MPREFHGLTTAPENSRFAIAVSAYNETVTSKLLLGAVQTLTKNGVLEEDIDVAWVPGAFELPIVVESLARTNKFAGIICLGAVIRGETTHDQHINRAVSMAIMRLGLKYQRPISFGLLTCDTFEQALDRAGGIHGNKGSECAEAALRLVNLLAKIDNTLIGPF